MARSNSLYVRLGQKRTFECVRAMSALPPKADMVQRGLDVRFVRTRETFRQGGAV